MIPFKAVLFIIGKPSIDNPSGSRGRKVRLSPAAVEHAMRDLPGKPICRSGCLKTHDNNNQIGEIQRAYAIGDMFCIEGEIFDQHAVDLDACTEPLGVSYDARNCHVRDVREREVWVVEAGDFIGVNVLLQRKAAHRENCLFWLEAA